MSAVPHGGRGVLVLPCDPASVRLARAHVRAVCRDAGVAAPLLDCAVLLTSELVTNAIVHGRSEPRLLARVDGGRVRVEVGDDNSRRPAPVEQGAAMLDGRGVAIVEVLALRWGVRDDVVGKVVWFEVG